MLANIDVNHLVTSKLTIFEISLCNRDLKKQNLPWGMSLPLKKTAIMIRLLTDLISLKMFFYFYFFFIFRCGFIVPSQWSFLKLHFTLLQNCAITFTTLFLFASAQKAKYQKENSIAGRTWNSTKLFVLKNDTAIADSNVPLIAENLYF